MKSIKYRVGITVAAALFLLGLASCKKTDTTNANTNYSAPLIDESTDWKRVANIPITGNNIDQGVPCRMAGYDLIVNGSAVTVLYSEDKFENGSYVPQYLKASYTIGSSNAPTISPLTGAPNLLNEPNLSIRPVLNPVSLNMETMSFWHNSSDPYYYLDLYDQATNRLTRQNPYIDPLHNAKMLANGDILAGSVNLSFVGELDYYNRASNQWTYMNQSAGDTQWVFAYTPFIINNGPPLAMRLYSLNSKAYMSIADFVLNASFPAAPYAARFTEEHPEYAPTGFTGVRPQYAANVQVVAYTTQGSTLTAVLMEKNNATSACTLSAYQWTQGATSFTRLYAAIPISADLAQVITLHTEQVGCNADGTLYALVLSGYDYHLALVSATGEKSVGTAFNNNAGRYVSFMSCLRSVNGSYYAVVAPFFAGADYTGQHMDIVKLTP